MVRLFVGGLREDVTAEMLASRFKPFGVVGHIEIVPQTDQDGRATSRCKGFGYVELEPADDKSLAKCISLYHNSKWRGATLRVEPAKPSYLDKYGVTWLGVASEDEDRPGDDAAAGPAAAPLRAKVHVVLQGKPSAIIRPETVEVEIPDGPGGGGHARSAHGGRTRAPRVGAQRRWWSGAAIRPGVQVSSYGELYREETGRDARAMLDGDVCAEGGSGEARGSGEGVVDEMEALREHRWAVAAEAEARAGAAAEAARAAAAAHGAQVAHAYPSDSDDGEHGRAPAAVRHEPPSAGTRPLATAMRAHSAAVLGAHSLSHSGHGGAQKRVTFAAVPASHAEAGAGADAVVRAAPHSPAQSPGEVRGGAKHKSTFQLKLAQARAKLEHRSQFHGFDFGLSSGELSGFSTGHDSSSPRGLLYSGHGGMWGSVVGGLRSDDDGEEHHHAGPRRGTPGPDCASAGRRGSGGAEHHSTAEGGAARRRSRKHARAESEERAVDFMDDGDRAAVQAGAASAKALGRFASDSEASESSEEGRGGAGRARGRPQGQARAKAGRGGKGPARSAGSGLQASLGAFLGGLTVEDERFSEQEALKAVRRPSKRGKMAGAPR
ncbi:unnamed protein product [Pedinophyceae sp. YPF-701]|nr:unnamed protein product [Pedinophyceae sp. YPF-701]